ncbi:MAG: menaquinone biosynthesis protein [Saprospiraceae bacterium]|nr:menaquinone biosynthesis protein [Saprospiraceae bacterium]
MVSYLNSKPFEQGLVNSIYGDEFEILTETPAVCAKLFDDNKVDIALIPSGALHDISGKYKIISDYCIGCDGAVRTVAIFSNEPLKQCKRLITDNHSRTSVLLSALLLDELFNLQPEIISANVDDFSLIPYDCMLMIGDKVFDKEPNFLYKYDVGLAWKELTGLPLAFAVWAAKIEVNDDIIAKLNHSFESGMNNLDKIIERESSENLDLYYYFKNNISYSFDQDKKTSLDLYLRNTKKYHNLVISKSNN